MRLVYSLVVISMLVEASPALAEINYFRRPIAAPDPADAHAHVALSADLVTPPRQWSVDAEIGSSFDTGSRSVGLGFIVGFGHAGLPLKPELNVTLDASDLATDGRSYSGQVALKLQLLKQDLGESASLSIGLLPKLDLGAGMVFRPSAKAQLDAGIFFGQLVAAPRFSPASTGYSLSAAAGVELVKPLSLTLLWSGNAAAFGGALESVAGAQLLWGGPQLRVGLLAQWRVPALDATSFGLSAGYTF